MDHTGLKIHRGHTEDGRAPPEFGPLGAAVGFQESKPPLLRDGAESHPQGLLEVELTQVLFGERHPLFGRVSVRVTH